MASSGQIDGVRLLEEETLELMQGGREVKKDFGMALTQTEFSRGGINKFA